MFSKPSFLQEFWSLSFWSLTKVITWRKTFNSSQKSLLIKNFSDQELLIIKFFLFWFATGSSWKSKVFRAHSQSSPLPGPQLVRKSHQRTPAGKGRLYWIAVWADDSSDQCPPNVRILSYLVELFFESLILMTIFFAIYSSAINWNPRTHLAYEKFKFTDLNFQCAGDRHDVRRAVPLRWTMLGH